MASPSPVARVALAALALAVGAGSVASALGLTRSLRREVEAASELGIERPGLVDDLRRSESPVRARLHLARALLGGALEEEPGPERRGRLEEAERLARSVLADHPAAWEAASIAGAALYLRWSEARDPLLLQEYRRWERPLLFALELAPEHRYPAGYLAAAYLELWPALSTEKRELTEELVASAFTDPRSFVALLDLWLRVADAETALEPIPDRTWAWSALRSRAGQTGDWSAYCDAWRRERNALARDLRARLAEAERQVAGGELARARGELLAVLAAAPPDPRLVPIVERALRLLPHGPRRNPSEPAARWLDWTLARELVDGARPLSIESLVRLRALAFPGVRAESASPPAAPLLAWVELARGREARADEIEAATGGSWQAEWAPYQLVSARHHLEKGRPERARRALRQVHPDWHRHPVFRRLEGRLADPRDPASMPPAGAELGGPLDWSYSGETASLALHTDEPTRGLAVTLAEVPAGGAAVAVRWDGATLACRPLAAGARRLELPLAADPGVHEIELEALAGGRVYAGTVVPLPPRRPARPG